MPSSSTPYSVTLVCADSRRAKGGGHSGGNSQRERLLVHDDPLRTRVIGLTRSDAFFSDPTTTRFFKSDALTGNPHTPERVRPLVCRLDVSETLRNLHCL